MSDHAARQTALDLERSVAIRAPAGSGKTGLLIQRMLKALAHVETPEAVLAITFTRKAAAEIRERLLAALLRARDPAPPPDAFEHRTWELARALQAHDQAQGWALQDNPARLRATTIDALNRELASKLPILSGLGGLPEPLDDARPLYREAILRCFAQLDDNASSPDLRRAIGAVLQLGRNRLDQLLDALCAMLATREQWLPACLASGDKGAVVGQQLIKDWQHQALEAADEAVAPQGRDEWLAAVTELRQVGPVPWGPLPPQWPTAIPAAIDDWLSLADSLLTKSGGWRQPKGLRADTGFPAKHPATQQAKVLLEEFAHAGEPAAAALAALRDLPRQYPEDLATLAQALSQVLLASSSELKLVFAQRQQADYAELALAAVEALGQLDSGAAEREDGRLRHLLVDELQDTSSAQIRLLELLVQSWQPGDGRRLFLVGDPQQSIYLFRQARVELFNAILERAQLGAVPLTVLQLSQNFRSRPALVQWCNQTLQTVFEERLSPIRFAASEAQRAASDDAAVELLACTDAAQEAEQAGALIEQWQANSPGARIGVLARSRARLAPVIEQLKRRGLPYAAQDLDALSSTAVARDRLACALALRHPQDDLQWLRLLRSPGVGLCWADLDALAVTQAAPWSARIRANPSALSADGQQRLTRLVTVLDEIESLPALRAHLPLASARLHAQLGMRDALDGDQRRDLQRLEDLLLRHCPAGQLDDEQALREDLERLYASAADAPIELMTVHKSKGLEFDYVILLGCSAALRAADRPLLRQQPHGAHWLLAPRPRSSDDRDSDASRVYRWLQADAEAAEAQEAQRLLYVACTRAREQLYLLYSPSQRRDRRSFTALLSCAISDLTVGAAVTPAEHWQDVLHPRLAADDCRPATVVEAPAASGGIAASPSRLTASQRDRVVSELDWPRIEASLIGSALHEALEHLADQDPSGWTPALRQRLRTPLRAGLARRGLPAPRCEPALERVMQLLESSLDGWGRYLLAPKPWAANEYALTGWRDGEWETAIIDRCFADPTGQLWVVDYKSNALQGDDPAHWASALCQHYDAQLLSYCRLLSDSQGGAPVSGLIYLLADERLMQRQSDGRWLTVSRVDTLQHHAIAASDLAASRKQTP